MLRTVNVIKLIKRVGVDGRTVTTVPDWATFERIANERPGRSLRCWGCHTGDYRIPHFNVLISNDEIIVHRAYEEYVK